MSEKPANQEIREWLEQREHSPEEVDRILKQLEKHDAQVVRESIFDSIDTGKFDIEQVINEALEKDDEA